MNKAQCNLCKDIIESEYRHDWVSCSCGEIFVDGGNDYHRAGARDFANFIPMYEPDIDASKSSISDVEVTT